MKRTMEVALITLVLAMAVPARGQYVFLDVNGDGRSSGSDGALPADRLNPSVTQVDVYFETDKNRDGSGAVCINSEDPLSIFSYEFTLHASGPGTVTYLAWTDNLGFGFGLVTCGDNTLCTAGQDAWVARGTTTAIAPGVYRVGTLTVSVTGTPVLDFVPDSPVLPYAQTAFGSMCVASGFNSTVKFGVDFTDSDGTEAPASASALTTVWEKVRSLYR
jgi:hypothetical protein